MNLTLRTRIHARLSPELSPAPRNALQSAATGRSARAGDHSAGSAYHDWRSPGIGARTVNPEVAGSSPVEPAISVTYARSRTGPKTSVNSITTACEDDELPGHWGTNCHPELSPPAAVGRGELGRNQSDRSRINGRAEVFAVDADLAGKGRAASPPARITVHTLEARHNVSAAAFSMAGAAGGAVKAIKTTPLMSIAEARSQFRGDLVFGPPRPAGAKVMGGGGRRGLG